MKVSVVTISFNQAAYLAECIDSIATQQGPLEHIIVDPGSLDGSRDVILARREHFSHIIFEPDYGPADGLNKGFRKASGDIYCYLNSDDVLLPHVFSEVRELFTRFTDIDVVAGGGFIIDEKGRQGRRIWSDPVSRIRLAHGGAILIQPSTFIRRDAFLRTTGFNVENRSNWDGELVVDLYETGAHFLCVENMWSMYRVHSHSITGNAKLDLNIREHGEKMHARLMGRAPGRIAKLRSLLFRVDRIVRHPSIILERLKHGKVYGGKAGKK